MRHGAPPSVHRHDETAIAHRCAVLWAAIVVRLVTRRQNGGLATLMLESRGLWPSARPGASQATLSITDSSISDELTYG